MTPANRIRKRARDRCHERTYGALPQFLNRSRRPRVGLVKEVIRMTTLLARHKGMFISAAVLVAIAIAVVLIVAYSGGSGGGGY